MDSSPPTWSRIAVIVARLIFAAVFAMALTFKVIGIGDTADQIKANGLPFPLLLAYAAAVFEFVLVACFLTGAFFSEACLAACVYVLFLGVVFHGPAHWAGNQSEFGFCVDHFTFLAGLLFAAAYGPGDWLALKRLRLISRGAQP
jgi:putative oxidoreductase